LVRTLAAGALAQRLAFQQEASPGQLDQKLIEQLLIYERHGALCYKWPQLAELDSFSS
jgi:hypothetical protein